jgi:hypothetical protein
MTLFFRIVAVTIAVALLLYCIFGYLFAMSIIVVTLVLLLLAPDVGPRSSRLPASI